MAEKETVRLFDKDAYATEFEATVIACEEIEQNNQKMYQVVLDQTLFFPEEGGQSPDQGTIDGVKVLDVQITKGIICHTLEAPMVVGTKIMGRVEWQHRFYNMQQHSGEHIFSGIVNRRLGYDNVGFHLSDSVVTMDFNGVIEAEEIEDIEDEVNMVIAKNIPIEVSYPTKEELEKLQYRSKIEIDGQVRIVTIPGYDVCACCAPHVKRTGEIGMLKVMNAQNYKGGMRISILCGFRALEAFRQKSAIVTELMNIFTTNQDALVENIEKLKSTSQSLKAQLAEAKQEVMEYKVANLPTDIDNAILFESNLDTPVMRNVVNQLVEKYDGISAIFVGNDTDGYNFIIGSQKTDCRIVATALKNKLEARGGGSAVMVQGSLKAQRKAIEFLLDDILGA